MGLALAGTIALSVAIAAAGHEVAVAVAVGALAALIGSYVRIGVLTITLFGKENARERLLRAGYVHLAIVVGAPLVLFAARPWGAVTLVVGFAALMGCHALYTYVAVAASVVRRRRANATPPSA